jgi:hypothetical protein
VLDERASEGGHVRVPEGEAHVDVTLVDDLVRVGEDLVDEVAVDDELLPLAGRDRGQPPSRMNARRT